MFLKVLLAFLCTENAFGFNIKVHNAQRNLGKYMKPNTLWPALPDRPFVTVWNVDTHNCKEKYNISIDLSYFDIVINQNETMNGDSIVIFYAPYMGLYPQYKDGMPLNGGIPQLGNIADHYEKCVKDVQKMIPDESFQGLAVIDWEAWRPIWDWNGWGEGKIYQTASIGKVQKEHPDWPETIVTERAVAEFEEAAKSYMLGTLELVKLMRPNAKWGYYLYPDCYNYAKNGSNFTCSNTTMARNDMIQWLYDASSGLYPSTYLGTWFKDKPTAQDYTMNRINEAKRVDYNRPGQASIPIYPYNNLVYRNTTEFLSLTDLDATSGTAAIIGASGVVLWADYMDNTKDICMELSHYVSTDLGPYMKFLSDSAVDCSYHLCNGHGRCVVAASRTHVRQEIPYSVDLLLKFVVPTGARYKIICVCYSGFAGDSCDHVTDET